MTFTREVLERFTALLRQRLLREPEMPEPSVRGYLVTSVREKFVNKALMPVVALLEGGITITPHNFIAEGDYVATQGRGNSRTKSGSSYNNTYCHVFRITNGKVQDVTEYLDSDLVTKAFGK